MFAIQEALNEADMQRKLLENLGFSVTTSTECVGDAINRIIERISNAEISVDYVDMYVLRLNVDRWDKWVGNCKIYLIGNDTCLVTVTLETSIISDEVINKLMLLGYRKDGSNWLEYKETIK